MGETREIKNTVSQPQRCQERSTGSGSLGWESMLFKSSPGWLEEQWIRTLQGLSVVWVRLAVSRFCNIGFRNLSFRKSGLLGV